MDRITRNAFWYIVAGALFTYTVTFLSIPQVILLQILNGLFIGMGFAVLFVFRRLIKKTVWSREEFDDVRMFAMSLLLGGIAITLMRLTNIINYAILIPAPPWYATMNITSFATYCAILAGAGMILSPGLNHGYLHGEDKRTVWGAIIFGLIVSIFLIWLQVSDDVKVIPAN